MRSGWLGMIEARALEVCANEHTLHTSIAKYSNLLVGWYLASMTNTSTESNKPWAGCCSSWWGGRILMEGSSLVLQELGLAPVSYSQHTLIPISCFMHRTEVIQVLAGHLVLFSSYLIPVSSESFLYQQQFHFNKQPTRLKIPLISKRLFTAAAISKRSVLEVPAVPGWVINKSVHWAVPKPGLCRCCEASAILTAGVARSVCKFLISN